MMRARMKEGVLLLHILIICATPRFRSSRRLNASPGAKRQPGKTNRLEPGSFKPGYYMFPLRFRSLWPFLPHPPSFDLSRPNRSYLFDPHGSNRGPLFGPTERNRGVRKDGGQKAGAGAGGRRGDWKGDGWKGQGRRAGGQGETGADEAMPGGQEEPALGGGAERKVGTDGRRGVDANRGGEEPMPEERKKPVSEGGVKSVPTGEGESEGAGAEGEGES